MKGCGWILVFSALALVALAKDWNKCFEECGGERSLEKASYEGSIFCYYMPDMGPEMITKCELDCVGEKPAADQKQCLCDFCKRLDNHRQFCKQPGVNQSITLAECDTKVCTGNGEAKFHGRYCSVWDEEEFKALKVYFHKE